MKKNSLIAQTAHIKNWAGSSLVYLHCTVAFTKQFWKFNERPQGRTWLDAFFVQKTSQSILCKLKSFQSEGAILSSEYRSFMLNYFVYFFTGQGLNLESDKKLINLGTHGKTSINLPTNLAKLSYFFRYLTSKLSKVLKNVLRFFYICGKRAWNHGIINLIRCIYLRCLIKMSILYYT